MKKGTLENLVGIEYPIFQGGMRGLQMQSLQLQSPTPEVLESSQQEMLTVTM